MSSRKNSTVKHAVTLALALSIIGIHKGTPALMLSPDDTEQTVEQRLSMVEEQIVRRGVTNPAVLKAMRKCSEGERLCTHIGSRTEHSTRICSKGKSYHALRRLDPGLSRR